MEFEAAAPQTGACLAQAIVLGGSKAAGGDDQIGLTAEGSEGAGDGLCSVAHGAGRHDIESDRVEPPRKPLGVGVGIEPLKDLLAGREDRRADTKRGPPVAPANQPDSQCFSTAIPGRNSALPVPVTSAAMGSRDASGGRPVGRPAVSVSAIPGHSPVTGRKS